MSFTTKNTIHKNRPAIAESIALLPAPNHLQKVETDQKKRENASPVIQPKLTVGAPDDPAEKEADQVADKVIRMARQSFVQRKYSHCENEKIQRNVSDKTGTSFLHAKANDNAGLPNNVANSILASQGNGRSLDGSAQSFMSRSFEKDFSDVKIHTDGEAARFNRYLNAKAFTVGQDIYFNEGQYQPEVPDGRQLLAHELTHVVQQSNTSSASLALRKAKTDSETEGYQEESWAKPSLTLSATPVHVATIYFKTKESYIDDQDHEVLKTLGVAYASYANRNAGQKGGELGLKGKVIGYADPRTSTKPGNEELSKKRAFWTAWRLKDHLAVESGLIHGNFEIEELGAGALARPADDGEVQVEGNTLATMRRADIFLAGQGTVVKDVITPVKDDDTAIKPPELQKWEKNGWDVFDDAIMNANKEEIRIMALRMLTNSFLNHAGDLFYFPTAAAVSGRSNVPQIDPVKPPWWDSRNDGLYQSQGRSAQRNELIGKSLLLKRDFIETAKWDEKHFTGADGSFVNLIKEVKKDSPDAKVIGEYVLNLGYLRFMIYATEDLGEEVLNLTKS